MSDMNKYSCFNFHYKKVENDVIRYKNYLIDKDILDIGSNIGFYSLAICRNLNYKSLHLFEPCKDYFEHSKIMLKDYNNIHYNNFGLGNIEETLTLYKNPGDNIGWNTFLDKDPNQSDNFINKMNKELCNIKILDDYYKDISNIDFIKIDVEGYEHNVINGGLKLISKFKPYLFIEVGWGKKHPCWDKCEESYRKIFEMGYKNIEFTNYTQDILFEPFK